jgi:hypothetical protein
VCKICHILHFILKIYHNFESYQNMLMSIVEFIDKMVNDLLQQKTNFINFPCSKYSLIPSCIQFNTPPLHVDLQTFHDSFSKHFSLLLALTQCSLQALLTSPNQVKFNLIPWHLFLSSILKISFGFIYLILFIVLIKTSMHDPMLWTCWPWLNTFISVFQN